MFFKKLFLLILCLIILVFLSVLNPRPKENPKSEEIPPVGKFNIVLDNSDYFYVFDLEEFKGHLYAFLSSRLDSKFPSGSSIMVLNDNKDSFDEYSKLQLDDNDTYIRNTFNDSGKQMFLVTSRKGNSGVIYVTKDMKSFKKVYSSDKFGFRSFNKFKNIYLAGTDSPGIILGSEDGENWDLKIESSYAGQLNETVYFKDRIFFVDNSSVFTTDDLKSF